MILALFDFVKEYTYRNLSLVFSSIPSSSYSIFKAIIIMGGYYFLECKSLCFSIDKGEKKTNKQKNYPLQLFHNVSTKIAKLILFSILKLTLPHIS